MQIRMQYLFFDMNSFFASVAQNEEPELIGRPVAVVTTDTPSAACIAVSYEAKALGVRGGLRRAEAQLLCPQLTFRPAYHDVYVKYHHRIRAAVEKIIPIAQAHSVDEFSCKLMGSQQDLSKALTLAGEVQGAILSHVGPALRCSVGVAPSVLLAKIAAELQKPAGINWLHPSVLPGKLAHLDLSDVPGVSKGILQRLHYAGVHEFSDLYALAPKQARAIWGSVIGEKMLRALHGEPVDWEQQQGKTIGHSQRLTGPNCTQNGARLVARRLIVKAAARLRREEKFTGRLSVSTRCQKRGRMGFSATFTPTQDTFSLLEAFGEIWPHLAPINAISVGITLEELSHLEDITGDLFSPRNMEAMEPREALCHALDQLNRRYGQDTIRFGELPPYRVPYTGAKIAFSRVPNAADFYE